MSEGCAYCRMVFDNGQPRPCCGPIITACWMKAFSSSSTPFSKNDLASWIRAALDGLN